MNPLDALDFPVFCQYPKCGEGPFIDSNQVDEHITEEHLAESVWSFAVDNMKPSTTAGDAGGEK